MKLRKIQMMNKYSRSILLQIILRDWITPSTAVKTDEDRTTVTPTSAENHKTKTQSSFKKYFRVSGKNHKTRLVYFERAPDIF